MNFLPNDFLMVQNRPVAVLIDIVLIAFSKEKKAISTLLFASKAKKQLKY